MSPRNPLLDDPEALAAVNLLIRKEFTLEQIVAVLVGPPNAGTLTVQVLSGPSHDATAQDFANAHHRKGQKS